MNRRQQKKAKMSASPVAQVPTPRKDMKISLDARLEMRAKPVSRSLEERVRALFTVAEPIKGVLPAGTPSGHKMAMDAGYSAENAYQSFALSNINEAFAQGYAWPGFTVLANWAQITEFRKPAEVYAREMTRKWIKLQATGDDDKSDKLKQIDAEFKRLNVQAVFREAIEQDALYGRSQIFLDMGMESDQLAPNELKTELVVTKEKIGKGALKRLTTIEPIWSYPNRYNANDPLDPTFYKPTSWFVMGKEIHSTRLLTIVTRDVPDILKPAYSFAGLSLSQMLKPYVDNWLRTRQSVSDLIHSFTVWVLKTNMASILNNGGAQELFSRLEIFNSARDNHGVNALDKDTEEFENVSAALGGLDKLQAQSQEQMCAPAGLPLVYLTGITPAGLNASSQDEIEVFQDTLHANQEILTPALSTILNVVQLSLFGEIDPEIGFVWNPLKVVTDKEKSEIRKMNAEIDIAYVDAGILDVKEPRKRIADEEDSPYAGIDVEMKITPPAEEPGKEDGMSAFQMGGEE